MMREGPLWAYKMGDGEQAVFVRVCPRCNRFVKPDKTITIKAYEIAPEPVEPNATCSKHGRVGMPFEGFP